MKKYVAFVVFSLGLLVACRGTTLESAQMPIAVGISKISTPTSEFIETAEIPSPEIIETAEAPSPEIIEAEETPSPETLEVTETPLTFETSEPIQTVIIPTLQVLPADPDPSKPVPNNTITTFGYEVINIYPHDEESSTQGLVVGDNPETMFEGSGLWGESSLREVNIETGEVIKFLPLSEAYFGEGVTLFNDRIIQLTWKSGLGFIYDKVSFDLLEVFNYAHEGWGITHDGERLIVSDGSNTIHFWDPETFQEVDRIHVFDAFGPVPLLNELEFVQGEILANVWQTDRIVRIDPHTGRVTGNVDLSGLLADEFRDGSEGVLNGIAYDPETGRLFVTGKRWPKLFEIKLVEIEN